MEAVCLEVEEDKAGVSPGEKECGSLEGEGGRELDSHHESIS